MKKFVVITALALSALTVTAAEVVESIVVRVGDRIVTRTQYAKILGDTMREIAEVAPPDQVAARQKEARETFTNELINQLLIKDRADRLGLTISEAEMKDSINRLKQQYGITTDQQFSDSLAKSGMTRADMESRLRDTLITQKVFGRELRGRNDMTDRELRERYDKEKEHYRLPERAHLREIVILRPTNALAAEEARKRSETVANDARSGDFAKIASTTSESGTKDKGGDLGEVARGELLPELDKAVFAAAPGTVIGPIETKSGWHIVKVEQRLPSEVPAFESLKERLRRDVSEETYQRDMKLYLDRLRKDAFIQINEQNIPKI